VDITPGNALLLTRGEYLLQHDDHIAISRNSPCSTMPGRCESALPVHRIGRPPLTNIRGQEQAVIGNHGSSVVFAPKALACSPGC